jgi:hypothetical protein
MPANADVGSADPAAELELEEGASASASASGVDEGVIEREKERDGMDAEREFAGDADAVKGGGEGKGAGCDAVLDSDAVTEARTVVLGVREIDAVATCVTDTNVEEVAVVVSDTLGA